MVTGKVLTVTLRCDRQHVQRALVESEPGESQPLMLASHVHRASLRTLELMGWTLPVFEASAQSDRPVTIGDLA